MKIQSIKPLAQLYILAEDGRSGIFDLTPYLEYEVFAELENQEAFVQVSNGGYFIEWACGADLSADSIEAHWQTYP
ncbi:MAG: DUF2442 domain-containing protein [Thiotrichaceae bacterium]|nr:DUF2442 domain-containing protein [Thiotrichaceae bacterium]